MPFYIVHAGTALKKCDVYGTLSAIALPAGVTVVATRPTRMAMLDKIIFLANAPSVNLVIDGTVTANLAGLTAPAAAPTVAAGAAGVLNGAYYAAFTYAIKVAGKIVAESPLSPSSAQSPTLANQKLAVGNITASVQAGVNCRRVYRSSSGGGAGASTLYWAHDIDDNATLTYASNEADADLDLLPVSLSDLGNAPGTTAADRLTLVVEWKDRLWGVSNLETDNLRYSGEKKPYAWKSTNMIPIGPVGEDALGITGFIRRRDELGVGRKRVLWKIVGSNPDEFRRIKVVEGVGIVAADSIQVVRDIGYFLAEDGVYTWGPDGVKSISDTQVRPWFTTDTYFNRALFSSAFSRYNPKWGTYELHLAAAGSTSIDRWVVYDIQRGVWFGPHKTAEFTPSCGALLEDPNGLSLMVQGGTDGVIWRMDRTVFSDGASAIDFDVKVRHVCKTPDIDKYFGEMALLVKDVGGGTLTITPTVGPLDTAASPDITHSLDLHRGRLRRLGCGRVLDLRFRNQEVGQEVEIYGYEIPWHELGRR